jgi:beta-xylosidase
MKRLLYFAFVLFITGFSQAQKNGPWISDNGDGTYTNPIIFADYSDPDVVRVGNDFYMTASSFNCVPGLPILHSNDLINWSIIGHAVQRLLPADVFSRPQHGNGIWAPSIRYHNDEFYIYYGDPDFGIFVVKSKKSEGSWNAPQLVHRAKGWIDPCPFWDDDGSIYLVHAFAKSRAGVKSILALHKMNPDGTALLDSGKIIYDGTVTQPTIEGPKLYKRNGYYYIFAPAGGVKQGWQTVLRSKNIYGPYEEKVVMSQGSTSINGPHQGAWVECLSGESWFIHFQDRGAYGRVVHLQPMKWRNDFPVIGFDDDGDGNGSPVEKWKKPNVGKIFPISVPQTSDEFNSGRIGLQWQWQANPETSWYSVTARSGYLRLFARSSSDSITNLWYRPNLLLQKYPAPKFTATTKIEYAVQRDGVRAGIVVMGTDYSYISVTRKDGKLFCSQSICLNADDHGVQNNSNGIELNDNELFLRIEIDTSAVCRFMYSGDGKNFVSIGEPFIAKPGKWIGAKIGLFCVSEYPVDQNDYVDIDWFHIQ